MLQESEKGYVKTPIVFIEFEIIDLKVRKVGDGYLLQPLVKFSILGPKQKVDAVCTPNLPYKFLPILEFKYAKAVYIHEKDKIYVYVEPIGVQYAEGVNEFGEPCVYFHYVVGWRTERVPS
ncbi:MAG: hypothetical protein ABWJ97_06035 [Thermoproteus sp.]